MGITYKWSDPQIAIKARLFIPGWQLHGVLKNIDTCIIAYDDDTPIGVGICQNYYDNTYDIQAFVRKAYRNRGIASKMLKLMKNKYKPKSIHAAEGVHGSRWFWRKHGIRCQNKVTYDYDD